MKEQLIIDEEKKQNFIQFNENSQNCMNLTDKEKLGIFIFFNLLGYSL